MKDTEYILKGTAEEIISILQKDFSMSRSEAKFFIYVMVDCQSGGTVNIASSREDLEAWYLDTNDEQCNGPIPYTHLVIHFSSMSTSTCHTAYNFLVRFLFNREIDLVTIGAGLVYNIVTAIKKIPDADYCVYARIIELCIGNKDRLIEINDIITANRDGYCDYLDSNWKCPYLGKAENCNCGKERIREALDDLTQKNILKRIGTRWKLIR